MHQSEIFAQGSWQLPFIDAMKGWLA